MATEIKSTSIKSQNIIAEPQVNKPGSPEAGQIIQATGTGDIAKGIYHYTGESFFSLDNAQGDLETLRLVLSTDTSAVDFNSALNSTSTLAGNTNAVPHETSTGTGLLGALEIPSTGGDALLTEFDANKVFRYFSAGANNNNDYFGIPIDIPAQTRGQNIVIKFKYRTEEASDTTSNGDFQVSVWDKTNGVKTTQDSTLTTGTTISAGSNILMTSKTNLSVGDKIWFETGGTGSTVGGVANSLTQAYITSISSTDNNITVSEDVQVIASGLAVTGWLSDKTSGLLPAADSDTNKVGKDFSIAVKTEEDTAQIVLYISNKSTTTNVIELFFDGILVSQNKFLQASSQTKSEGYYTTQFAGFWQATGTTFLFNTTNLASGGNTPPLASSRLISISDVSSKTRITAKQDIVLDVTLTNNNAASNATEIYNSDDQAISMFFSTSAHWGNVSASVSLKKYDYIYFKAGSNSSAEGGLNLTATPETSDVILLESQDEIFTDWQSWTPTWGGFASATGSFHYRRNGSNMEMIIDAIPGTTTGTNVSFSLPSGYVIDSTKFDNTVNTPIAAAAKNTFLTGNYAWVVGSKSTEQDFTKIFIGIQNGTNSSFNRVAGTSFGTGAELTGFISVPIQGWNANFNPLLSMPLVELGTDFGYFNGYLNGGVGPGSSYRKYIDTTYIDTLSTSGLGTLTKGSSTAAFNFQASANCIVTVNYTFGASTGIQMGPVFGAAAAVTDSTKAMNTSDLDGLRAAVVEQPASSGQGQNSARFPLKAGENFQMAQSTTGTAYSGGINSLFSIMVERDRNNTSMAHIIKPAVAYLKQVETANAGGGGVTAGSWQDREINTVAGESWFVSLTGTGTTGAGGTNTEFTLEPGLYKIKARFAFYKTDETLMRLYQVGGTNAYYYGECSAWGSGDNGYGWNLVETLLTVQGTAAEREYKFQYNVAGNAGGSTNAQGIPRNTNPPGTELYGTVTIEKLK
jgi:hypothetical protein